MEELMRECASDLALICTESYGFRKLNIDHDDIDQILHASDKDKTAMQLAEECHELAEAIVLNVHKTVKLPRKTQTLLDMNEEENLFKVKLEGILLSTREKDKQDQLAQEMAVRIAEETEFPEPLLCPISPGRSNSPYLSSERQLFADDPTMAVYNKDENPLVRSHRKKKILLRMYKQAEKDLLWQKFEDKSFNKHIQRLELARKSRQTKKENTPSIQKRSFEAVPQHKKKTTEVCNRFPETDQRKKPLLTTRAGKDATTGYLAKYQSHREAKMESVATEEENCLSDTAPTEEVKDTRISFYANGNRSNMQFSTVRSMDEIEEISLEKLALSFISKIMRETAKITAENRLARYEQITNFSQIKNGDVLCIEGSSINPLNEPHPVNADADTTNSDKISAQLARDMETPLARIQHLRDTRQNTWDEHGRQLLVDPHLP